jgi:uncharacterized protein (DUF885 family)
MTQYDPALVDAFLAHHWTYHPVDATFMGARGFDHLLPPAGADTLAAELAGIATLEARIAGMDEPEDVGGRHDLRTIRAELAIQRAAAERRPRLNNPAWYSGEAAFSVISLLLPQSLPVRGEAVLARLGGMPAFLAQGIERLAGLAIPAGWVERARREAVATAAFLREDMRLHEAYAEAWAGPAGVAADALEAFAAGLDGHADADPACGADYLDILIRQVHGLDMSAEEALARAQAAFDRMGVEMEEMAAAIDPDKSVAEILAELSERQPKDANEIMALYRSLDAEALNAGAPFVTPAREYGLDYRWMAPCFRRISQTLYFLFYRSPPGLDAGAGSVYWLTPAGDNEAAFLAANNVPVVKMIHAVHHGSIGHHTQNTRARKAPSRLGKIAGTDCAWGLAFLGSGTLIEGWACYVEDLLMEAPGFYDAAENLLLKQFERRNAASVLVDIKLHLGQWTLEEAMNFYQAKAGFAPARVHGEVVRNSMLPGSRLMYWLGVEGIKALRARWQGDTRAFHDMLLSFGHVPLAWVGEEMQRAGKLAR